MKIACFVMTYNEEMMLPIFIDYYSKFCDKIYVMDNCSTDNTTNIALKNGCEVISWKNDEIKEEAYLYIKTTIYKQYRHLYDYIIVCDCDEILYHKDIVGYIKRNPNIDIFRTNGYQMISRKFNFSSFESLCESVRDPHYDKPIIFKSNINIQYEVGCHNVIGMVATRSEFELRHFKYIDYDFVVKRYNIYQQRLSETNKIRQWGYQYNWCPEEINKHFCELESNKIKVEWL